MDRRLLLLALEQSKNKICIKKTKRELRVPTYEPCPDHKNHFFLNQLVQSTARYFNQFCLSNPPEMEFKEFEPRFKSAKPRFKLITGLNLETFDTILSGTNHI